MTIYRVIYKITGDASGAYDGEDFDSSFKADAFAKGLLELGYATDARIICAEALTKDTKNEKAEKLASYCANAQGRAYQALCVESAPAARTLQRAELVAKMAEDIARYFFANDGLTYDDIKTAGDILTDNNAHIARRVLEIVAL